MHRLTTLALTALLLTTAALPARAAEKTAICRVCVVNHGEAEPEEVKATRTYQGKAYAFCSEKCAKTFDADPAAFVEPEFPRAAPAFALKDLAGKPLTSASLKGKVVLLDFWATWCAPCKKSMPEMQALHDRYAARGFAVVGISIDEGGPARVKKFVESKGYTYPMAVDSEKNPTWGAYGVKAVPAAFLLDREGRIVAQWHGAPKSEEVEAKLKEMLRVD